MAVVEKEPVAALRAPLPPRRRAGWLLPALAVMVPAGLFVWHATLYGSWEIDDAGITFAYARSVATGAGAAEPVASMKRG